MKLKLYYRSPVIWNMILYVMLSLTFLYFQFLYMNTESILNKITLNLFMGENVLLLSVFGLTIISFLKADGFVSKIFFSLSITLTVLFTIQNLMLDFSKFLLLILFFYILIAFYLYQFFSADSEEAYLNPGYENNLLFSPLLKKISITILAENELKITGYLTNWGERGCFVVLEDKLTQVKKVKIHIHAFDNDFLEVGDIVSKSSDERGYGLKFQEIKKEENNDNLGWNDFYEIIDEMGFQPELLR